MKKSIVLLSGGLDSSVNFLKALRETEVLLALTFDYGQRAAEKEIRAAREMCENTHTQHRVVDLKWLRDITKTSLVNRDNDVPINMAIDNLDDCKVTANKVWVPNRNGVFLNIAASFAEALGADCIIPGFNREEAATFPDNSEDYMDAVTNALSYSTQNRVEVVCFTAGLNKTEIVQLGYELGLKFKTVWPCYFSGDQICGQCESCLRFARALSAAAIGAVDSVNDKSASELKIS